MAKDLHLLTSQIKFSWGVHMPTASIQNPDLAPGRLIVRRKSHLFEMELDEHRY